MPDRCVWCHRSDEPLTTIRVERPAWLPSHVNEEEVVVHPDHEEPVRAFYAAVRRHGPTAFRLLIRIALFGSLAAAGTAFVSPFLSLGVAVLMLVGIGATLLRYPFSTPETVQLFGIRRARRIARGVGLACILFGLGLAGWGLSLF